MNAQWFFVINPVSGKGKGLKAWQQIKPLLDANGINYAFAISAYHKHTIALVAEKYQTGTRHFLGIGGDGTLNELLNGILRTAGNSFANDCTFGLLPVGTGNDWVRSQPEKLTTGNIIQKLKNEKATLYDVGVVASESFAEKHYFLNVAGAGLDGSVVQEIERLAASGSKGKVAYVRGLIQALFTFNAPISLVHSGQTELFHGVALVITAAKGQYFGGGMHISPYALPANGLLDITIVEKTLKRKIFPQLPKLFSGKLDSVSFVLKNQNRELEIIADAALPVQADGEFVGEAKSISFSVLPKAIKGLT
jgi:YegS/Rv2252/BmrU family lipid kinase